MSTERINAICQVLRAYGHDLLALEHGFSDQDVAEGDYAQAILDALDPRPEPVVAPLPTEAVEALAAVIRPHDGYPQHHTSACVCSRILVGDYAEHLAKNLIAAGYRLPPEDDEDTVRDGMTRAWEKGYSAGWADCGDIDVGDPTDTPNPYRAESTR